MIFQKIGFGDYFNNAFIFFSVILANQNHWKTKSFPNPNLTVAEQRCVVPLTIVKISEQGFLGPYFPPKISHDMTKSNFGKILSHFSTL